MARGFGYLVAIIDLLSRKVLAHRLSNRMTADFCIAALQEALARFGTPEIFNPTRGAQLTDTDFTHTLSAHGIAIHMDGKGRCIDNVFSERLWRSVKHEDVYLRAYESLAEAGRGLAAYFSLYKSPARIRVSSTAPRTRCASLPRRRPKAGLRQLNFEHGFPTAGRRCVRRTRPRRPAVENPAPQFITLVRASAVHRTGATSPCRAHPRIAHKVDERQSPFESGFSTLCRVPRIHVGTPFRRPVIGEICLPF